MLKKSRLLLNDRKIMYDMPLLPVGDNSFVLFLLCFQTDTSFFFFLGCWCKLENQEENITQRILIIKHPFRNLFNICPNHDSFLLWSLGNCKILNFFFYKFIFITSFTRYWCSNFYTFQLGQELTYKIHTNMKHDPNFDLLFAISDLSGHLTFDSFKPSTVTIKIYIKNKRKQFLLIYLTRRNGCHRGISLDFWFYRHLEHYSFSHCFTFLLLWNFASSVMTPLAHQPHSESTNLYIACFRIGKT